MIFAVTDYIHRDGIRCLLRYVPDGHGDRMARGRRYRKLDFDESFEFLRQNKPEYLRDIHVVPEEDVLTLYKPECWLPEVAKRDHRVLKIMSILKDGGVPPGKMGITGSILVGLHDQSSDIDFVVYGRDWWKARDLISLAKSNGEIDDLDEEMWRKIYAKRSPEISFDEFLLHEMRKGNRGAVDGTYFDLLFTRDWSQIRPNPPGKKIGRRLIVAEVIDSEFAFDNPAILKLDHEISEIHCYTHTYAGQALPGEKIEAMGVVESTDLGPRLIVGTTREAKGEWIRSLTLLERFS